MSPNAFIGKKQPPTTADLAQALGTALPLWNQLLEEMASQHGITEQEWNSYSPKAGWSLRLKQKRRNIVYLIPTDHSLTVSFALGDKAVEAASHSKLSKEVKQNIAGSKRYAEGTAVRLDVKSPKDIATVVTLAGFKIAS